MSRRVLPMSDRRAFTLIEVLLGVLILGLGLLGLASVFPLVVRQQRESLDSVLGGSSVQGAKSIIQGHFNLNHPSTKRGWAALSIDLATAAAGNANRRSLWSDALGSSNPRLNLYGDIQGVSPKPEPGSIFIWDATTYTPSAGNEPNVIIRTSDRLLPSGPGVTPQYVWDVVPILASSVPATAQATQQPLPLRVAVFVRRIDPGIRLPTGTTLAEAIAKGTVTAIAVDNNDRPTLDGRGRYATFFTADPTAVGSRFDTPGAPQDVLEFDIPENPADARNLALRQIGQLLVDTNGNVFTVTAIPDSTGGKFASKRSVVVTPPLSADMVSSIRTGGGVNVPKPQFLFSPVLPASVSVEVIRP